jgi:hypothetical protein
VQTIVQGIEATEIVPGRCEVVDEDQPFGVVVDSARTPASLARLMDSMRETKPKRVILVTGCQGDQDKGIRPFIGEVAHYKVGVSSCGYEIFFSFAFGVEKEGGFLFLPEGKIFPLHKKKGQRGTLSRSASSW